MNLWSNNTLVPSQPFSKICFHGNRMQRVLSLKTVEYNASTGGI